MRTAPGAERTPRRVWRRQCACGIGPCGARAETSWACLRQPVSFWKRWAAPSPAPRPRCPRRCAAPPCVWPASAARARRPPQQELNMTVTRPRPVPRRARTGSQRPGHGRYRSMRPSDSGGWDEELRPAGSAGRPAGPDRRRPRAGRHRDPTRLAAPRGPPRADLPGRDGSTAMTGPAVPEDPGNTPEWQPRTDPGRHRPGQGRVAAGRRPDAVAGPGPAIEAEREE